MISVEKNTDCIKWFKDGKLHRDNDQPAVILADGTRCWYKDGIKYTPNKSHTIQEKPLIQIKSQQIINIVVESLKDTDYKSIQETSDGILIKY